MTRSRILVIEDGHEYVENLTRFLSDAFDFERAGGGAAALERLAAGGVAAIFLDMRFDRVPAGALLGDLAGLAERFNGDPARARRFLEDNQGTYILAAIRQAGHRQTAIFSYDFDGEPRRWRRLRGAHGPVEYLNDSASPEEIRRALAAAVG